MYGPQSGNQYGWCFFFESKKVFTIVFLESCKIAIIGICSDDTYRQLNTTLTICRKFYKNKISCDFVPYPLLLSAC